GANPGGTGAPAGVTTERDSQSIADIGSCDPEPWASAAGACAISTSTSATAVAPSVAPIQVNLQPLFGGIGLHVPQIGVTGDSNPRQNDQNDDCLEDAPHMPFFPATCR